MKSATVSLQSAQSNPMTFAPLIRADTFPSSPDQDFIIELHPIQLHLKLKSCQKQFFRNIDTTCEVTLCQEIITRQRTQLIDVSSWS